MNKTEFYILNSFYNGSIGRANCTSDIDNTSALEDKGVFSFLEKEGYIDDGTITPKGTEALEPYKVDNAIILAAGASTRFIPLSLEQPKAMFEVRGERLIERQIKQLKDAGIEDISIVVGYKKEMFNYLKDKFNVKLIENPLFNIKNNVESLYLARNELKNTYICVSDSYYVENPFNKYEYQSFNTGAFTKEKNNEMYAIIDGNKQIQELTKKVDSGFYILGHCFWNKEFSSSVRELIESDREIGKYNNVFYEYLLADHLNDLPPYYLKEYKEGNIFEFDYFEELREFDDKYLSNSHSEIIRNIKLVFRCDEEDIVDFRNVSKGLTNTSFIFKIDDVDYIYRHPGDGTDSIISRRNEKKSLIKAHELGLDPTYVYEDINEGWKISKYIKEFREPDYSNFEDSKKIIKVLQKLHSSNVTCDYGLKPWEDSLKLEELLIQKNYNFDDNFKSLKNNINELYKLTLNDSVEKCFTHGDTYSPNWMITPSETILIDWEYSGFSDPGIDVGYYIVDAQYSIEGGVKFIKEYLNGDNKYLRHFEIYTALIAYYWYVWALYRESCGAFIGESLDIWHKEAIKWSDYLNKE